MENRIGYIKIIIFQSEPYMLLPWLILIPIFIVLYIAGTIYFMFVEIPHEACLLTQFIVIGAITRE